MKLDQLEKELTQILNSLSRELDCLRYNDNVDWGAIRVGEEINSTLVEFKDVLLDYLKEVTNNGEEIQRYTFQTRLKRSRSTTCN